MRGLWVRVSVRGVWVRVSVRGVKREGGEGRPSHAFTFSCARSVEKERVEEQESELECV